MQIRQPGSEVPEDEDAAKDAAAAAEFTAALEAFEATHPVEPVAPAPHARPAKSDTVRLGQRVRGRVVSVSADSVLVDYGGRSEAVVDARELRTPEGVLDAEPGQTIDLVVTAVGETITLGRGAKRGGKAGRSLEAMRQARAADLPVRGKVTGVNKGGLTVDVEGSRGFCPLSQIDIAKVEDPAPLVGRVLEFLVTEVDAARGNAVLSRRRFLQREQEQRAQDRVAALAPGQEVEGTVTRLEPFGAFIDLGGIEGLAHVTELAHSRVAHPRDVLAVGDHVHAKVLRVEQAAAGGTEDAAGHREADKSGRESGRAGRGARRGTAKPRTRVSLSLKAVATDPWATVAERFQVGGRVSGVVVRLTDFGAFVNLAPGIDGLVHVSQVSERRIEHVREVLTPGQGVEVTVLAVEPDKHRVSLSMREAAGETSVPPSRMTRDEGARPPRARAAGAERGRPPREGGDRERPGRDRSSRERSGHDRGDRERPERTITSSSSRSPSEPEPLTPMQLAFKRARESAERGKSR